MNDVEYIAGREEYVQSLIDRDGYILEETMICDKRTPVFYKTKDGYFEVLDFDENGRLIKIETSDGWESWTYHENGFIKSHQYSNGVTEYISNKNDSLMLYNSLGFMVIIPNIDITKNMDINRMYDMIRMGLTHTLGNSNKHDKYYSAPSENIFQSLYNILGYDLYSKLQSVEIQKISVAKVYRGLLLRLPKSVLLSKLYGGRNTNEPSIKDKLDFFNSVHATWVCTTIPEKYCESDDGEYVDFYKYNIKLTFSGAKIDIKHYITHNYYVLSEKTGDPIKRTKTMVDKSYKRTIHLDTHGGCISDSSEYNNKYLPVVITELNDYIERIDNMVSFFRPIFDRLIQDGFAYNEFDYDKLDFADIDYDEILYIENACSRYTQSDFVRGELETNYRLRISELESVCNKLGVKLELNF